MEQLSPLQEAVQLEKSGERQKAALLYEKLSQQATYRERALTRLLVIYRQLKKYAKELNTIERLINLQEKSYAPSMRKGNKVQALSKQLNQSLGRVDKKGNPLYQPDPISQLLKRKERVKVKLHGAG